MLVSAKSLASLKRRVAGNSGGTAGSLIASRPSVDERFLFLDNRSWTMDHHSPSSMVHGQVMEVRMLDKLSEIEKAAMESLNAIHDSGALEAWRVANVGRSSPLMQVFSELGKLSKEE